MNNKSEEIKKRLEYLRGEIQAERISYGEIAELQSLAQYIDAGDVELLEAVGVPEFEPAIEDKDRNHIAEQIQLGEDEGDFVGEDGTRIMWSLSIDMKL